MADTLLQVSSPKHRKLMLCDRCQSKEAVVHISTIMHAGPPAHEEHLCPECAEILQATNPLLNPHTPPTPTVRVQPVMSLSGAAKARVRSVNDKLAELEPILRTFCAHRGYALREPSDASLWPFRSALAHGEIHRCLDLNTDAKFLDILKRGFWREMPWSLYASAAGVAPRQPWRILTTALFRRLPFCDLASVLEQRLEEGFSILRQLTLQDVLARGEIARGPSRVFQGYP